MLDKVKIIKKHSREQFGDRDLTTKVHEDKKERYRKSVNDYLAEVANDAQSEYTCHWCGEVIKESPHIVNNGEVDIVHLHEECRKELIAWRNKSQQE